MPRCTMAIVSCCDDKAVKTGEARELVDGLSWKGVWVLTGRLRTPQQIFFN